ncbi:hypothetical protein [Jatrophihabitans sp.]|jgi:hypothetical protein|uniref:hypothetical protein n=1 Tax=Jatrophihabitans sp. TaxID=1932789 RepID=UPI002EEF276D
MTTSTRTRPNVPTGSPAPRPGPLGSVITASMATGAAGAAALTFAVLPDASEATIVGAGLVAFALGWAMLGWLTIRLTSRPQRWAYVPAAVMAAAGTVMLAVNPGEPTMTRLAWGWAPALVVLAVWVARRTRRNVPGRRRLLLYPVTLVMLLAGSAACTRSRRSRRVWQPGRCRASSSMSAGTACT